MVTIFDWVFSNRVICTRLHRAACTDEGSGVPLFFSAYSGKIKAARSAGAGDAVRAALMFIGFLCILRTVLRRWGMSPPAFLKVLNRSFDIQNREKGCLR
ncbi:MAG: hypothetical protein PVI82_08740, partial [Desulfobacterales bacterium]